MGTAISKAADGVGGLLGNAFMAPLKAVFGQSCQDICSGPWDVICFLEHLCVSSLLRLLMILVLCYITLLLFYILFKVGICQCICRSLCKMGWAACEAYWFALEDITCFLWHKLVNTKRTYRGHRRHNFEDIEQGFCSTSSDENDFSVDNYHKLIKATARDYSLKRGRRERSNSFRNSSGFDVSRRRRLVKLKTQKVSAHAKGRSNRLRSSRRLQPRKVKSLGREAKISKRRRLR